MYEAYANRAIFAAIFQNNDMEKTPISKSNEKPEGRSLNFIEQIIEDDNSSGKFQNRVHTRFPPEPNGYLHIGHAKSICLNFGLAKKYNGKTNLRFDDTNPVKEEQEYVDSIMEDVKWLGFDWEDRLYYASDYFQQLFDWACFLIKKGKAYVCDLSPEQISAERGTPTVAGKDSPFRSRSINENLDLFMQMKDGVYPDGSKTLRAKIDMQSPNMHMRDPVLYRILTATHHRTGDAWRIYPMYDFAHGQSDSLEGITHSICTLEFEVHRPLYEWFLTELEIYRPQQIEFARLNLSYTVMSKRKLLQLVKDGDVMGWNDPRMPTISGLRRRGYTPESIRDFADKVGIAKRDNLIELSLLEHCLRDDLNKKAQRVMGIINPLKIKLIDFPENQSEWVEAINNPENPDDGKRMIAISPEIYIERDDFMEDPPKKFFRLSPGKEVRLRYAYYITCVEVVKDENGNITEILCTYDPETKGGNSPDGRKVQGTIHWVSAAHCIPAEIRLFDRLFKVETPDNVEEGQNFKDNLNPHSMTIVTGLLEPSLADAKPFIPYQFERIGYFCVDEDSKPENLVFNRTVGLKDSWSKIEKKGI
jgi:glutaminyl-tRNA synthetase